MITPRLFNRSCDDISLLRLGSRIGVAAISTQAVVSVAMRRARPAVSGWPCVRDVISDAGTAWGCSRWALRPSEDLHYRMASCGPIRDVRTAYLNGARVKEPQAILGKLVCVLAVRRGPDDNLFECTRR